MERPSVDIADSVTDSPRPIKRRIVLPLSLFVLTCISTFWAGAAGEPLQYLERSQSMGSLLPVRRVILENYHQGLVYMAGLLSILFAHEMGHFVATVLYRIPASFPYFLPLPVTPIGTLGAVISVDGRLADRKQIFDIGLAGPIAGLVVAVPMMCYAAYNLKINLGNGYGGWQLEMPLGVWLILRLFGPELPDGARYLWLGHLQGNPLFVAGWVGFLITGLNMVPISQLDGGHVAYSLLGRRSYWIARFILLVVGLHVLWSFVMHQEPSPWLVMALLVLIIGPYHPPTRNDHAPIGLWRTLLGYASLVIPLFCLPLQPLRAAGFDASDPEDGAAVRMMLERYSITSGMEAPRGCKPLGGAIDVCVTEYGVTRQSAVPSPGAVGLDGCLGKIKERSGDCNSRENVDSCGRAEPCAICQSKGGGALWAISPRVSRAGIADSTHTGPCPPRLPRYS